MSGQDFGQCRVKEQGRTVDKKPEREQYGIFMEDYPINMAVNSRRSGQSP
jgi:hypothetical protein